MGLGVVASAFSFVKLYPLVQIIQHEPTDATYQLSIICVWGFIELWIVLIALSIPPIWPLLKPYFGDAIATGTWSWSWTKGRMGKSGNSSDSSSRDWKSLKNSEDSPQQNSYLISPESQHSYEFERQRNNYPGGQYGPIRAKTEIVVSSESFV